MHKAGAKAYVCVLSYKVCCAYTPSNRAMVLLNKISVFPCGRERERDTDTDTDTDRDTDRQTDRQRTETETERQRQRDRDTETQRDRDRVRDTERAITKQNLPQNSQIYVFKVLQSFKHF